MIDRFLESLVSYCQLDQFHLGTSQLNTCRHDIQVLDTCCNDCIFRVLIILYEDLMRRDIQITLGDSDATGCIPLRVDINNQNLFSLNGQTCCQVYIRGRFPNTTLD